MTKKNLALAASMIALAMMSGQAFAGTVKPNAWPEAAAFSDSQAPHVFNASHAEMARRPSSRMRTAITADRKSTTRV